MSDNRDKQTNALLGVICSLTDEHEDEGLELPVSLVVNGQLITGVIISENAFYKLPENEVLSTIYNTMRGEKLKYFDEKGNFKNPEISEEEIAAIPDEIWQRFIYLKDARYISGNFFIPSGNVPGIAIQVRGSDVSAFNMGAFTATKNEKID